MADTPTSTTPQNQAPLDGALDSPPKHRYPIPTGIQPTNFVQVSAVDSVRGVYTIDPGLSPPASLMTPGSYSGWQNAVVESQKGNINIDLFVLPNSDERSTISMTLKSQNGSASVRIHDAKPQDVSYIRGPINITVNASKKADIYIPRSFKGPLQMVTGSTGEVYYSTAVRAKVAPLFSGNGQHKCFIGGLSVDRDNGQTWPGDQLTAHANEVVSIYYDDEGNIPTRDPSTLYWAKFQHRLTRRAKQSTRPLRAFRVRATTSLRAFPGRARGSLRTFRARHRTTLRILYMLPVIPFLLIGLYAADAGSRIKKFFTRSTRRQQNMYTYN